MTNIRLTSPTQFSSTFPSIPTSKSITNRALILAAQSSSLITIGAPAICDDSTVLRQALSQIGVGIETTPDRWVVSGSNGAPPRFIGKIDVGNAGTSARFLLPLLCFSPGTEATLVGSNRMHERPIGPLVDTLRELGAKIEYLGTSGSLPLQISGVCASRNKAQLISDFSSQFLSALLLSAPLHKNGLVIITEKEVPSKSYLELTASVLRDFGYMYETFGREHRVSSAVAPVNHHYEVEMDASSAAYFWGLGALSRDPINTATISQQSAQADLQLLPVLSEMGCVVRYGDAISVAAPARLSPISANLSCMPDASLIVAVLSSTADGISKLTGLKTLLHKESNRLFALRTELAKCGIRTEIDDDSITIWGGHPHAARINTHDDHRLAMAFSILCATTGEMIIESSEVVSKSFPNYWDELITLGVTISCV